MVETPQKRKITSAFVILVAIGVIGAAVFSHIENKFGGSEKEELEVKVAKESSGQENSLADIMLNEATEENIEQDASSLEINADESANEEMATQSEEEISNSQAVVPDSEPKKNSDGELKIGFVTDIHAKSSSDGAGGRVLKPFYFSGINYFLSQMDSSFHPDLILANGDVIEGTRTDSETGKEEISLVRALFEKTAIPKYWVVGNHDLRSVDKSQWKEALGIDYLWKSFEVDGYKIIILDSNFTTDDEDIVPNTYYTRGHVAEEEIVWLEKELRSTDKEIIVFIHHPPLWNVDWKGNESLLSNALVLQSLLVKNNVLAVFSGHMEDIFIDKKGGMKYFVLPGFTKNTKYQKSFSQITIKNGKIFVDMSYLADEEKYRTVRIAEED